MKSWAVGLVIEDELESFGGIVRPDTAVQEKAVSGLRDCKTLERDYLLHKLARPVDGERGELILRFEDLFERICSLVVGVS